MAPVENETVFVRGVNGVYKACVTYSSRTLITYTLVRYAGFGTLNVDDEGLTWCRAEHEAMFRVTVALS